jgi:hypothetical protein
MDTAMNVWRYSVSIHLAGDTISKRLLESQIYVGRRLIRDHRQKKHQPVETHPSKKETSNVVLLVQLIRAQEAFAPVRVTKSFIIFL